MNKGTSPTSAGFRPKMQSRPLQSAAGSSTKSTSPVVVEKIQPPYPRPVSRSQPSLLPSRDVWGPIPPPADERLRFFLGGPPEVCPKTMTLKKGGFWSSGRMHSEKDPIEFGQYLVSKYGPLRDLDDSQYSACENEALEYLWSCPDLWREEEHGGDRRDGDIGPDFDRVVRSCGLENTPVVRPKMQSRPLQSASGSSTKSTSPVVVENIQPPYPRPVSRSQPSLLPSRDVWGPPPPPVDERFFVGGPLEVCPKTTTLEKGGFWSSGRMHSEKDPIQFCQYLVSKYGHDPRDNSQYSAFENEALEYLCSCPDLWREEEHGGDRRDGDRNDDNVGPDFDRVLRTLGLENTPVTVIRPGLCAPVFCVPKALDDALASMDIDEAERFISSLSEEERFRLGLPSSYKGSSCKESDHFLSTFCPIDGPGIVDVELWREYYRQIRESEGFDVDVSVYPGSCIAATIIPMDLCKYGPDFYTFVESMATMALDQFNKSVGVGEEYQFLEIERVNTSFSGCYMYYITFAATKMATGGAATANSSSRKLFQAKVRETLWGEYTVVLVRPKT